MMDTLDTLGCGRPLEIGVPAPAFTLTMVETDRPVSAADQRGKSPLLLGLYLRKPELVPNTLPQSCLVDSNSTRTESFVATGPHPGAASRVDASMPANHNV